jgi:hypothetical protein
MMFDDQALSIFDDNIKPDDQHITKGKKIFCPALNVQILATKYLMDRWILYNACDA